MSESPDKLAIRKAYIRRMGNPYASLQVDGGTEEFEAPKVSAEEQHSYIRHPYALIPQTEEAQEVEARPVVKLPVSPTRGTLTKTEFRAKCRRIFIPYIPALEKGKLRKRHRDFIARNESRSPDMRHRLITHLEKYDLSQVQGITNAQFNREREVFTDEKLEQIERLVDSEG